MGTHFFAVSMQKHVFFVIVAALFFILQFIRTRRPYQLVMAAAFAVSLLIYADLSSEKLFYGVGIAEAALLCVAFILSIIGSVKASREEKQRKALEAEAEASSDEEDEANAEE